MTPRQHTRRRLAAAAASLILGVAGCRPPGAASPPADSAAVAAMAGMDHRHGAGDPHLRLTPLQRASRADSARFDSLVARVRDSLSRFRDVRVAEAEGYRPFLPGVPQSVYHFSNWHYSLEARWRFDARHPAALLYRRDRDGGYRWVGVMYTAARSASLEELDRRVPLGLAAWHEHVNWCVPPLGQRARWTESRDGHPVFGPRSPIATAEACRAVGGRFVPIMFGWMVHLEVADTAPAVGD